MKLQTLAVVDDYPPLGRALGFALRFAGWDVALFGHPLAAWSYMRHHEAVALLTDYRMPGLNGLQFVRELRAAGWDRPVLLMTAAPGDIDHAWAERLGVVTILGKPFPLNVLRERLRSLVLAKSPAPEDLGRSDGTACLARQESAV